MYIFSGSTSVLQEKIQSVHPSIYKNSVKIISYLQAFRAYFRGLGLDLAFFGSILGILGLGLSLLLQILGVLGLDSNHLGPILGSGPYFGPIYGVLDLSFGPLIFWAILQVLGLDLVKFWHILGFLGLNLANLGPIWGVLGIQLAHFGPSWRFWPLLWPYFGGSEP